MIFCQVKVETPRNFFSSAAASTGLLLSAAAACTLTTRAGSCGRPLIPAGLADCAGGGRAGGRQGMDWRRRRGGDPLVSCAVAPPAPDGPIGRNPTPWGRQGAAETPARS